MAHTILNLDLPVEIDPEYRDDALALQPSGKSDATHNFYWGNAPLRLLIALPLGARFSEGENYLVLIGTTSPKDRPLLPPWHADRFFTKLTVLKHIANPADYERQTGEQLPRNRMSQVLSKSFYNPTGQIIINEGDGLEIANAGGRPYVSGIVRPNQGQPYLDVVVSGVSLKFGMNIIPADVLRNRG